MSEPQPSRSLLVGLVVDLIRLYQRTLSRLLGPVCRFEPSCSAYAIACLEMHGAVRGSLLSIRRVCKCHPFHPGGIDYPPPRPARPHSSSRSTPPPKASPPPHARPHAAD